MKIYVMTTAILVSLTACNFEDINTKSYEVTRKQQEGDNVFLGSTFTKMEKTVIPIGTASEGTGPPNNYQLSDHLAADVWSGYFGENNNWNNGINNTTFYLVDWWVTMAYDRMYRDMFTPWLKIKRNTDENNKQLFALAQILKISAWHRATDTFGPIPYKDVDKGALKVSYNSQKEVYQSFFDDLAQSIKVLSEYLAGGGDKIVPRYDAVYEGDVTKWIKYANSLMLRLAMRVVYADPAMAKKYAEQAVNDPVGTMTAMDDASKMGEGAGMQFYNPIYVFSEQYNEARMGSTIYSFLNGYNDPRLSKYFLEGKYDDSSGYYAIPAGNAQGKNDTYTAYSKPNITENTPLYWLRTSEVLFLKSEGALRGWNMGGTAQSFYESGVRMSFQENGASGADAYLQNNTDMPTNYTDMKTSDAFTAETDLTIQWNDSDSFERKLERIITQKWLALFPHGQEAWSEWRRTGYPKLPLYNGTSLVVNNTSSGVIDSKKGMRRMQYPSSLYKTDRENVEKAVSLLGGPDTGATRLWWDKKPFN